MTFMCRIFSNDQQFILCFYKGRMIALPVDFLPFDPNHDNEDMDDEEETSSENDEDLNEDNRHNSIENGENNYDQKQTQHIGGGVVLVSLLFSIYIYEFLQMRNQLYIEIKCILYRPTNYKKNVRLLT